MSSCRRRKARTALGNRSTPPITTASRYKTVAARLEPANAETRTAARSDAPEPAVVAARPWRDHQDSTGWSSSGPPSGAACMPARSATTRATAEGFVADGS